VARLHVVGARRPAPIAPRLTGADYVLPELVHVERSRSCRPACAAAGLAAARGLAAAADRLLAGVPVLRLHGDLHLGNVLERDGELQLVDFDDCRIGPAVQDLWLALPGRDRESEALRAELLAGYATFRDFDRGELALVEALRGLRLAHYAAWVVRRWHDPVFPRTWPQFATDEHWERETADLEQQLVLVERGGGGPQGTISEEAGEAEAELGNADFFWDWEEK
jgi:Ser/Thr protein kinase RdoA (MazF antagonist)